MNKPRSHNDTGSFSREERKAIIKEALKEYISEQLAHFGAWSIKRLALLAFGSLMLIYFWSHGWKLPQ